MSGKIVIGRVSEYPPKGFTSVRVDRESVLGNPFPINHNRDRKESCRMYAEWFETQVTKAGSPVNVLFTQLLMRINKGENLCLEYWCSPKQCHAETIKEWLEYNVCQNNTVR